MEIKLISCPLCLKPHFPGVDSLRSSLISVATSNLKCPVCSETLLGLDKLTIHLFTHIAENSNAYTETGKSEKEIDESIHNLGQTLIEDDHEAVRCDICCFSFTDKTILDMHQKLLHQTTPDETTGMYNYHCHLCSKKFKKRGSLIVHLRVAHFGYTFQSECVKKNQHQSATETISQSPQQVKDNKQWECDVCYKTFTTKYFLKKHKRLHTGEMPYFCAQCNKSFTFQQSYHKHMLYHSSEKPYVCNECGRAFKELSTLQNHARIHSGERPFGCETCGKKFRQRVSYLVHQRIHTGVMPYKCTACNKSFRYKVSQRSHKCPMNPPGAVVRINENVDKINKTPETITNNTKDASLSIKCIMSVDYDTGNINFIQEDPKQNIVDNILPQTGSPSNIVESVLDNSSNSIFSTEQPDLFSMVLSPLLPDVESLCLTNSPITSDLTEVEKNESQTSKDDPFKDFFV